jgi:hypothetical protein
MVSSDERLRRVSDFIYQEANPPEDRHQPLEWRRNFNIVCLPLINIKIVSTFNVHDTDWNPCNKGTDSPWQLINPEINTTRSISAFIDDEKMRDTIFCAVVDEKEKGIIRLERPQGSTKVILRTGKPTEGSEKFPGGIYPGSCFRMNFEPGEDYLFFEMSLPENQMNDIMECLSRDPNVQIEVDVNFLSFSFEVDDALREWYHPRDLFIEDKAPAPVRSVSTSSSIGARLDTSDKRSEEGENACTDGVHVQNAPMNQVPIDLSSVTKALTRLTVAIWVLIAIIAYMLIK